MRTEFADIAGLIADMVRFMHVQEHMCLPVSALTVKSAKSCAYRGQLELHDFQCDAEVPLMMGSLGGIEKEYLFEVHKRYLSRQ